MSEVEKPDIYGDDAPEYDEEGPHRIYAWRDGVALSKALTGRSVAALLLTKDRESAFFVLDNGKIIEARCTGDCCSVTWFADIVGVSNLFAEVDSVEDIPLPEFVNVSDGRGRQEEDTAYAVRVNTSRGACEFIYRNSSNGYYGGDFSTYVVEALPAGLDEITEDVGA